MYNEKYYADKKQKIQEKFQKAQQKWIQFCELSGKEYIDFLQTAQDLQEQLKLLEAEEKESKK
jgi:hypothetical protein